MSTFRISPWLIAASATALAAACTMPNPAFFKARVDASPPGSGGAPGDAQNAEVSSPPDLGRPDIGGDEVDQPDNAPPTPDGAAEVSAPPDLAVEAPSPDLTPDMPADVAPEAAPPDPRLMMGIVAQFTFDQAPTSGNSITDPATGNRATFTATRVVDIAAPGGPATARSLEFNGSAHVTIDMPNVPCRADRTVALWFRATATTPTVRTLVAMFYGQEILFQGFQLGLNGTSLSAWRFGADGPEINATATLNTWHHAAYTYTTATGTHRLFVDGQRSPMTINAALNACTIDTTLIGTYDPPNNEMFRGQMSDLRIYNRVLGDDEIALLARRR